MHDSKPRGLVRLAQLLSVFFAACCVSSSCGFSSCGCFTFKKVRTGKNECASKLLMVINSIPSNSGNVFIIKPLAFVLGATLLTRPPGPFGVPFQARAEESAGTTAIATVATQGLSINSLQEFLRVLDSGEVSTVIFNGINPTSATVQFKSGDKATFSESQGFPRYDDPNSPSGPTQLVARVQHTAGVVCIQDISASMGKLSKKKVFAQKPMLSHSAYPKTYAYDSAEFKTVGEAPQYLQRYDAK